MSNPRLIVVLMLAQLSVFGCTTINKEHTRSMQSAYDKLVVNCDPLAALDTIKRVPDNSLSYELDTTTNGTGIVREMHRIPKEKIVRFIERVRSYLDRCATESGIEAQRTCFARLPNEYDQADPRTSESSLMLDSEPYSWEQFAFLTYPSSIITACSSSLGKQLIESSSGAEKQNSHECKLAASVYRYCNARVAASNKPDEINAYRAEQFQEYHSLSGTYNFYERGAVREDTTALPASLCRGYAPSDDTHSVNQHVQSACGHRVELPAFAQ